MSDEQQMNWPTFWLTLIASTGWVAGIAAAKGFWLTALAVLVPPAAWVIAAQWALRAADAQLTC